MIKVSVDSTGSGMRIRNGILQKTLPQKKSVINMHLFCLTSPFALQPFAKMLFFFNAAKVETVRIFSSIFLWFLLSTLRVSNHGVLYFLVT